MEKFKITDMFFLDKIERNRNFFYIFAFILVIAVIITFLPSLLNGFTNWDDNIYITDNVKIRALTWKNIVHIFSSTHYGGYEPLTEFVFAIDYHFFKLNPFIYHLNNLILHIINSLLVFILINLLSRHKTISLLSSLFWALHPMRVESVAWAAERKDVLFTMFFLIALITYILYSDKKNFYLYVLSVIFFIFCLLPKAQGLMFPFVLIIIDYFYGKKINLKTLINKIPYFIISGIFFIILFAGEVKFSRMGTLADVSFFHNILYAFFGLVFYIIKFLIPINLSACYPLPEKYWGFHMMLLYYTAPVIVIVSAYLIFKTRKFDKKYYFAALFYFINLFIVLQLKRTGTAVVADRYSYIPYIGLSYITADSLFFLFNHNKRKHVKMLFLFFTVSMILLLSFFSWQHCKVWKDNYTLWDDALKKYPDTALANHNFAAANVNRNGGNEKAVKYYKRSIELDPVNDVSYSNLAVLYIEMGEKDKALELFNTGLKYHNKLSRYHYNYALVYLKLNMKDKALNEYDKSIELNPEYADAYNAAGSLYYELKDIDKALDYFKKTVQFNPDDYSGHYNLGTINKTLKNFNEALAEYNKALRLNPSLTQGYFEAGEIYQMKGMLNNAIRYYEDALNADPTIKIVYNNLGTCYAMKNDLKSAVKYWKKGLELDPDNQNLIFNLNQAIKIMQTNQ